MILPAVSNGGFCSNAGFCNFCFIFFFKKNLLLTFTWKNYAPLFFKTDTCIFSKGSCSYVIQSAIVAAVIKDVIFHSFCETQQIRNKVRPLYVKTAQISLKYE